jgi:protein TonB
MADLFSSLAGTSSAHPRRWWSSVPFSVLVHGIALAAIVIVPLAATGALPTPASMMVFSIAPPPSPPEVPAVPRVVPSSVAPVVSTVPLEAPATIVADPDPPPAPPSTALSVASGEIAGLLDDHSPVTLAVPPPTSVAPVRVTSLMRTPVRTFEVQPVYPATARSAKVSGVVIIEAVIGVDGRVTDAHVLRPMPLLDAAALAAVRQWRYSPTILNGVAVPVILTVTVNFTLK